MDPRREIWNAVKIPFLIGFVMTAVLNRHFLASALIGPSLALTEKALGGSFTESRLFPPFLDLASSLAIRDEELAYAPLHNLVEKGLTLGPIHRETAFNALQMLNQKNLGYDLTIRELETGYRTQDTDYFQQLLLLANDLESKNVKDSYPTLAKVAEWGLENASTRRTRLDSYSLLQKLVQKGFGLDEAVRMIANKRLYSDSYEFIDRLGYLAFELIKQDRSDTVVQLFLVERIRADLFAKNPNSFSKLQAENSRNYDSDRLIQFEWLEAGLENNKTALAIIEHVLPELKANIFPIAERLQRPVSSGREEFYPVAFDFAEKVLNGIFLNDWTQNECRLTVDSLNILTELVKKKAYLSEAEALAEKFSKNKNKEISSAANRVLEQIRSLKEKS